jgi:hypothetical protein
VTLLDDKIEDSTDCYLLKIELDVKKLLEFLMNQTTMGVAIPGFDNQDIINNRQETEIGNSIDMMNMTMTEWIAKDTYSVMKAEATLDMTTTNPDTEEETTIAIDFNMRYYDYNVPVTIKLPAEAEDATDFSDLLGMLPG